MIRYYRLQVTRLWKQAWGLFAVTSCTATANTSQRVLMAFTITYPLVWQLKLVVSQYSCTNWASRKGWTHSTHRSMSVCLSFVSSFKIMVYACVAKWCILSPWRMATEKNAIRKPCWKSFYSSAVYYIVSKLVNPCGLLTTDHHNANLFHVEVNNKQLCIQLQGPRSSSSNWMNFQLHQWSRRRRCLVHSPHPILTSKHHWPVHSQFPFTTDNGSSPRPQSTSHSHEKASLTSPQSVFFHKGSSPRPQSTSLSHEKASLTGPRSVSLHKGSSPRPQSTSLSHEKASLTSPQSVSRHKGSSPRPQSTFLTHEKASLTGPRSVSLHKGSSPRPQSTSLSHEKASSSVVGDREDTNRKYIHCTNYNGS